MDKKQLQNQTRINGIIDSIKATIENPESERARKSDCYAQCALFINENFDQSKELKIDIYGDRNGYPMHGVVSNKNGDILLDTFEKHRVNINSEQDSIFYQKGDQKVNVDKICSMESDLWFPSSYKEEIDYSQAKAFLRQRDNIEIAKRDNTSKRKPFNP